VPKKARVVVVTGASAGVGRATAVEFASKGAFIGLLARGLDGLEGARRDVEAAGGRGLVLQTDVSDAQQVEAAATRVEEEFGPVDVWVNNAMVSVFSPILETTPEEYRRVTEVTYLGAVHGTLSALRRMKQRDSGVIVQVGSALAYRSIPLQSAYCAAKQALKGFTDSLRTELCHDGSRVKVSMVQLPALNTPQFSWVRSRLPRHPQPVPPIFQPEVAARAIVYAAEHHPRELYVGGPTVKAIVGNKFMPGLLDRYLAKTGYESQQADFPVQPKRQDNLFYPVAGDHGAHGIFDERARDRSWQLWGRTNAAWLGALAVGLVAAGIGIKTNEESRPLAKRWLRDLAA
jgi:NAD(P)-dependent dehydrogenase (short-subunit alcohol dehydrogenase family)